jgi:hypothetical protein
LYLAVRKQFFDIAEHILIAMLGGSDKLAKPLLEASLKIAFSNGHAFDSWMVRIGIVL